jgi:hypothetical protein
MFLSPQKWSRLAVVSAALHAFAGSGTDRASMKQKSAISSDRQNRTPGLFRRSACLQVEAGEKISVLLGPC